MTDEVPALTPKTRVSLPIAIAVPVLLAVVGGAVAAGRWMSALDWTLRTQGERLASIDAKVSQFNPAAVRTEAEAVCRRLIDGEVWVMGGSCVRRGNHLECQLKKQPRREPSAE